MVAPLLLTVVKILMREVDHLTLGPRLECISKKKQSY